MDSARLHAVQQPTGPQIVHVVGKPREIRLSYALLKLIEAEVKLVIAWHYVIDACGTRLSEESSRNAHCVRMLFKISIICAPLYATANIDPLRKSPFKVTIALGILLFEE